MTVETREETTWSELKMTGSANVKMTSKIMGMEYYGACMGVVRIA